MRKKYCCMDARVLKLVKMVLMRVYRLGNADGNADGRVHLPGVDLGLESTPSSSKMDDRCLLITLLGVDSSGDPKRRDWVSKAREGVVGVVLCPFW